jgi:hypothetical protein
VELFLLALTAIATVVGTVGGLFLQHRGNKHFEEQNRIMIEQGGGSATQAHIYKPPRWPFIAMALMVLLCWGGAIYDQFQRRSGGQQSLPASWNSYPLKRVEHQRFKNQTVKLDDNEYIDVIFENVTFVYNGKAPTRLNGVQFAPVKPGELAGRIGSDNPVVVQTLQLAAAIDAAGGCNATVTPGADIQ